MRICFHVTFIGSFLVNGCERVRIERLGTMIGFETDEVFSMWPIYKSSVAYLQGR